MRAWRVERHGEPLDVLRLSTREPPDPPPGHVLVRVAGAALSLPDVLMCRDAYAYTPPLPFTPGQEIVGTVAALGDGVDKTAIPLGARVMAITRFDEGNGGFAELTIARATNTYRVPAALPDSQAAGFLIAYLTGWLGLATRGRLKRGEWLAVLGAAGGTGSAAVRIGRALGARVIAVAGGEAKAAHCRALGAEFVVDHRVEAVADRLLDLTDGRGVDAVYDPVGGEPAREALRGVASEGRLLAIGFASGDGTQPSSRDVLRRNASIVGVFTGAYDRPALESVLAELGALVAAGTLAPAPVTIVRFDEIPDALERVARRAAVGKLVAMP